MLRRISVVLGVAALLLATVTRGDAAPPAGDPRIAAIERSVALFRERIERNPSDYLSANRLARLHVLASQRRADVERLATAERVLRQALEVRPDYEPARINLVHVLATQHRFAEAEALAAQLATEAEDAVSPRLILADAAMERGHLDEAQRLLNGLRADEPRSPSVLARAAGLAEARGDLREAVALAKRALRLADDLFGDDTVAWFHARLADLYYHSGQLDAAEAHFREALDWDPGDTFALAGLGDVHAARWQIGAALEVYRQAAEIAPHPGVLARLAALEEAAGQPEAAYRHTVQLQASLTLSNVRRRVFRRDLAAFYADRGHHLDEALALARQELTERQDSGAHDLLAWTLYRRGDLDGAAEAMRTALASGTAEPSILEHAAIIAQARGEDEAARAHLRRLIGYGAYHLSPQGWDLLGALAR